MNPNRLAGWLRPLMPEQIDTWLRARDLSDASTRQLIDQQIIATAHRIFGDPRRRMILSLPPKRITHHPMRLGAVQYDRQRGIFGLSNAQLLQHLAIFGRSGAGKTNVVMTLFKQLIERNIPVLFLDWKRNAREILPHVRKPVNVLTAGRSLKPLPFNPFIPPKGIESHIYIQHVVDVLSEAFTLGDGSRRLIQKAIVSSNERLNRAPNAQELLEELEALPEPKGHKSIKGWKATAGRVLEELAYANLVGGSDKEQQKFARNLLTGTNIVELDGLSQSVRRFLIPLLFSWVYHTMLASPNREKLSLVIVLEEAHNVLYKGVRATESLTEQLLRQCREVGIGVVLIDQQPNQISPTVLGNVHTSICMNLKDPADISRGAGLSLLTDDEKYYLSQLEVGQGIVKLQSGWQRPFLVHFDHLPIQKGKVTDQHLKATKVRYSPLSRHFRPDFGESGHFRHFRVSDGPFIGREKHLFDLIRDIYHHPHDGVSERYQRLGISVDSGNRLKEDLVAVGWVKQEQVQIGLTRRAILTLTTEGRHVFGLPPQILQPVANPTPSSKSGWVDVGAVIDLIQHEKELGHESFEHAYWKHRYASRLKELGYQVQVEHPIEGGFADIYAAPAPGSSESENHTTSSRLRGVIIEIETGKSDYISNLKRALKSGVDSIVIVATTKQTAEKITRKLVEEGYLPMDKIQIVIRDQFEWFD